MSSLTSSEKCLKYQETRKLMVVGTNLPEYSFSLDSSNFITITVSCFFQSANFTLLIFEDMSVQFPGLKNQVGHSIIILSEDNVP